MTPAQSNLKDVSFSHLFPLEVTRALSYHLTLAVAYTHKQGYVHGDLHLRNILVKLPSSLDQLSVEQFYKTHGEPDTVQITQRDGKPLPPNLPARAVIPLFLGTDAEEFTLNDARVLLSDSGESLNQTSNPRKGKNCHTPLAVRPPEALFQPEAPLSFSADIWSLATSIWEILGMKAIFSSEYSSADELAPQQIDILGPVPQHWWDQWKERGEFFDLNGRPVEGRYVWPPMEQAFKEGIQKYGRLGQLGEYGKDETDAILDLMRRMFAFRPEDQPTAEEVLRSEWMVKWCLPDFERGLHLSR
ncbi:hypothetical protein N7452_003399 [Penicillium brevicompactum]|uniref:Protein kinase domain-containing protein n=1 Tax=Penicillium brevicompactum TaxID=5074 RepID=A0A9W9QTF2_PENBR|nr:hypothetical protein N7452_003399 [Penicillium brevicompactum]